MTACAVLKDSLSGLHLGLVVINEPSFFPLVAYFVTESPSVKFYTDQIHYLFLKERKLSFFPSLTIVPNFVERGLRGGNRGGQMDRRTDRFRFFAKKYM